MTDIVNAPPFMPSKPQWDATVKLLERALEELAQAQAERDAAREHAERQQLSKDGLYRELREVSSQRDAARAEVARLTAALKEYGWHLDNCPAADCSTTTCECGYAALRQPAPAPTQEQE